MGHLSWKLDSDDAIHWAARFSRDGAVDVAFLAAEQGVFFARRRESPERPSPWDAPVLRLLRGIYQRHPRQATAIAKNTVFVAHDPAAAEEGAVKVAGRRMKRLSLSALEAASAADDRPTFDMGADLDPWKGIAVESPEEGDFLGLAVDLSRRAPSLGMSVAALAVDSNGKILSAAIKDLERNSMAHAEAILVEALGSIPPGSTIYSSLKPCKMCAGLIWDAMPAELRMTLRIEYAEDDPKRYARETVLDRGSMTRRRYASSPEEQNAILQIKASR